MTLHGEQRYRQAMLKARIIRDRSMRRMLAGIDPWAIGGNDRDCIVAELDRAFEAGQQSENKRCIQRLVEIVADRIERRKWAGNDYIMAAARASRRGDQP